MSVENWSEKLVPDDLSEDLKILSDAVGFEVVRALIRGAAGLFFYLPKVPPRALIEREIRAVYTGETFVGKRLALRLGISEKLLFRIAAEMEATGITFSK